MTGKILAGVIVLTALIAGVSMYYLQVHAFYDRVTGTGVDDVQLTSLVSGLPEPILYEDFQAIDSDSSPIRYRACFSTIHSLAMLTETYQGLESAEPRIAPDWFDCFDADAIGKALEDGEALAFLGTENIRYGIDRVVAILPDGRGFAWHEINRCGAEIYDGKPAPSDCPPRPESEN